MRPNIKRFASAATGRLRGIEFALSLLARAGLEVWIAFQSRDAASLDVAASCVSVALGLWATPQTRA